MTRFLAGMAVTAACYLVGYDTIVAGLHKLDSLARAAYARAQTTVDDAKRGAK